MVLILGLKKHAHPNKIKCAIKKNLKHGPGSDVQRINELEIAPLKALGFKRSGRVIHPVPNSGVYKLMYLGEGKQVRAGALDLLVCHSVFWC